MQTPVRVLIAEDDDRDFDLIEKALEGSGYAVEIARVRDGVEATEYLAGLAPYSDRVVHRFPDVALIDLKMPRMNGFELLEWIQRHPQHRVVPAIVMSSSASPADVDRAYGVGAHTYFVKPIQYTTFVELFKTFAAYWSRAATPGMVHRSLRAVR